MPVEGLEPTGQAAAGQGQGQQTQAAASDATAQNTATQAAAGAVTDTAQQNTQAQEKTFTQADVDRIIQTRLKSAVKAELKKLGGDDTTGANGVEQMQQQLTDYQTRLQAFEAKATVRDYLTDAKNKLAIPSDALSEVEELVQRQLEYGDDGKPTNLKEAVESVKNRFPRLCTAPTSSINANNGRSNAPAPKNMNDFIRQAAGVSAN